MKKIFFVVVVSSLFFTQSAFAGKGYTTDTQPATCVDGDFWIDTNGTTGERFYVCEEGAWVKSVGYGTSANPSFNSIHASGGNMAAANKQVTKAWQTGLPYTANVTSVIYGGKHYICTSSHTADSTTEPGVGASWATVWSEVTGGGVSAWSDIQALLTGSGTYVKADGTTGDPTGTITTGTGVAAAMANPLDGTGGLASKASLDALPNIVFGTGIAVAEDTPSVNYDTVSIDADTTPTDGSAKPITSNAVFDALAGKQNADADLTTAAGATGAGNSKYFGTDSSGTVGFYDLPSGSGSFTFDTFPQYEDSAHSSGIAVNGTTLAVYSSTAGKWLTVGLTDSLDAAPVTYAATLTITDASSTGDTFTLNSIAYDVADSPVSVTDLPTATEQITYTGSNTASCTGDVTGTGPWTINASQATIACSVTVNSVSYYGQNVVGPLLFGPPSGETLYLFPLNDTPTSGTLANYTFNVRASSENRSLLFALYSESGGVVTLVPGSETASTVTSAPMYNASVDGEELSFYPGSAASIVSGTTYYLGLRAGGYAQVMGWTNTGSRYSCTLASGAVWPATKTLSTCSVNTQMPGKALIGVNP